MKISWRCSCVLALLLAQACFSDSGSGGGGDGTEDGADDGGTDTGDGGDDGGTDDGGTGTDGGGTGDGGTGDGSGDDGGTTTGDGGTGTGTDTTTGGETTGDTTGGTTGGTSGGVCGDGQEDPGEECDDGNTVTEECEYGLEECTVCAEDCTEQDGATSYCGDGVFDPNNEECDDGQATANCEADCTVCNWPNPSLDQNLEECQSPPVTQCTSSFILTNGQSAAQGFQPGQNGYLQRVSLALSNVAYATNNVQVSIVDGASDPLALESYTSGQIQANTLGVTEAPGTNMKAWVDFEFDEPIPVQLGRNYFIVARLVGLNTPDTAYWGMYNYWQDEQTDSYPNGRMFSCGTGCPGFTAAPEYRDHEFRVWISTDLCE